MKKFIPLLSILLFLASCQTRVVSVLKPIQPNSVELYEKYTIQTNDAKIVKMEVLRQDNDNIYGKTKTGEEVVIEKKEIREMKKFNVLASVGLLVVALAAVIFVPI